VTYTITDRQRDCLNFVTAEIHAGRSPSYEEIARGLNILSKGGVHRLIENLVIRGYLRRLPTRKRCLALPEASCPHCGHSIERMVT
jgi:repressor LexA